MQNFRLAVAQINSEKGNIENNIHRHVRTMNISASHNCSMVVFPELSLTGYEPFLASSLAVKEDDQRLKAMSDAAVKYNIWAVAGLPLLNGNNIEIGAVIFSPNGEISTYSKMHLHPGEDEFFTAANTPKIVEIENQKIALAICADTNSEEHVAYYAQNGATVYVAGVLISEEGYVADTEKLQHYAKQYNMLVTMANHNQPTGGWSPIGKSAAWASHGLLSVANDHTDSLVVSYQTNGSWEAETIAI